jgi:8-oxo-dGTP diphosphatase
MKEELNIDIEDENIDVKHISHRIRKNSRVYFDIYLKVNNYSGKIKNNEPEKCSELKFVNLDNYDKDDKDEMI